MFPWWRGLLLHLLHHRRGQPTLVILGLAGHARQSSLRAVGVASLLAVASVVVNYPALTAHSVEDELIALEDPVALLLEGGE